MTQFFAAFTAGVVTTGILVLALGGDGPGHNQLGGAAAADTGDSASAPPNASVQTNRMTVAATAPPARLLNPQADPSMDEQTLLDELAGAAVQRVRTRTIQRLGFVGTDASVPALAELAERGRPTDRPNAIGALGGIGTSKAVDILIALSDSGPTYQKRSAIAALGQAGGTVASQWLQELADGGSKQLAAAALRALAAAAGDGAQEYLLSRLQGGDLRVAVAAAQAMSQLGTPEALDALLAVIRSSSAPTVRQAAIRGLAGFDSQRARRALAAAARGTVASESSAAVDALSEIADAAAVKILQDVALKGAPSARSSAAYGLGRIGDALARDALIKVLSADDNYTAWAAARGLADIFDDESIEALLRAIEGSQQRAQAALSALSGAPRDERVVRALKRRLADGNNANLLAQLVPALASMLGDEAIPLIEGLMETMAANRQYALISALTQIGTVAAHQALRRLVDKAPPNLQVQALSALVNSGALPKDEIRELILARMANGIGHQSYQYADMLARLGDDASNTALVGMLGTVSPSYVGGVASAILNQGSQSSVATLVEFVRTAGDKRRQSLLASMANSPKPEVRALMIEIAEGDNKDADQVLRNMAWNNPELVKDTALSGMSSERPSRRAASVSVLGRLTDSASLEQVVEATGDKDDAVRQAALSALQNNQSKGATEALMKVFPTLKDRDKGSLMYGLARTGKPAAIALIKETLEAGGTSKHSAFHALMSQSSGQVMDYLKGLAAGDDDVAKFVAGQLKQQLGSEFEGTAVNSSP